MSSSGSTTLGFGGWNYPYLYRGPSGLPVGFMADVWSTFPGVTFEKFPYENSSGIECDGVLQAIQQGRILTSADGSSLIGFRQQLFHISAPVYYTAFEFFEADRGGEIASADLVFFTVFSIPALCLLLALHFIASFIQFLCSILESANDSRGIKRSSIYHVFKSLSGVVYVLGITVTVYYHSAGFRGNAIDFKHGGKTSFSELLTGLTSGSRKLITMEENAFDEQELLALFGSAKPMILNEPDQATLLQRLCDEKNLVAMLETNMIKSMSLVDRPCQVDNIPVNHTPGLERLGAQVMQNYLFARNLTSKRTIEDVNQILLRMYSQERIENLWTKRYLKALRNYEDPLEEDLGVDDDYYFMPMSLLRLELLFFVTIPGWILSALVFVVEVATANSRISRVLRVMHNPEIATQKFNLIP